MSDNLDTIVNDAGKLEDVIIPLITGGISIDEIKDVRKTRWSTRYNVDDIDKEIERIYKENDHLFNYDGMNTFQKIQSLIDSTFKVIHNEVHDRRYIKTRGTKDWTLYDDLPLVHFLKSEAEDGKGVKGFSDKDLDAVVDHLALRVNPIKQYFGELKDWDGKTDYLKKFTDCFDTTDQKFFYEMLKKNLVRTIKCAFENDYENRYLFIFVGGQQSGKTKAIQFLNPFYEDRGYGKYHSHAPIKVGEKDAIISSSKVFIWNVEEFETLKGKEMSFFKGIISQGNTTIRPAYSKHERDVIRRCTYMASTNRDEFLSDNENTRYLCVRLLNDKTNQIRYGQYNKIGIDKIWSQIYSLYKDKKYDCELTSAEKEWQAEKNNHYNVITFTSEIMEDLYRAPKDGDSVQYLSLVDIKRDVDSILGDKHQTSSYAIKDAAGHLSLPYKQFWVGDQNIGHKFAVVRLKEGDEKFIPTNIGVWKQ